MRFDGAEHRRARPRATSSSVTAAMRDGDGREHVDAGDGLEVPELMRDVRHAVVVEDEPRLELRLRLGELRVGDAVAPHAIELLEQHRFDRRRAACPSVAVADSV